MGGRLPLCLDAGCLVQCSDLGECPAALQSMATPNLNHLGTLNYPNILSEPSLQGYRPESRHSHIGAPIRTLNRFAVNKRVSSFYTFRGASNASCDLLLIVRRVITSDWISSHPRSSPMYLLSAAKGYCATNNHDIPRTREEGYGRQGLPS